MEAPLSTESFAAILALVGVVIVLAALLSGFIERSNFPQVAVFLALGAMLGPAGLGLLHITLESPILRVVATLSLTLVLFTDAVTLSIPEVRRHARLALLVLGPGTLFSAALIALASWWLIGLAPAPAIVLGAALASTDPVLLRGFLRRPDVPAAARQALRLESGLNDVVLLPIVLVAMLFLGANAEAAAGETPWVRLGINLFLLGPAAGVLVGLLGVSTLDLVRRRIGVRRDYESIYSLGIAFAAFAAAEAVHGSGFLAAFMAGLTIAALDVELCDCFLEYGETTAEMALLFTFVLLGSSLIWSGLALLSAASVLFAVATLLIRPAIYHLALLPARIDARSRRLIAWFGARGLSSLLLVLLPVFAGLPGAAPIFSYCCLVVVLSVALHGGSLMLLGKARPGETTPPPSDGGRTIALPAAPETAGEEPAAESPSDIDRERITLAQMRKLRERGEIVLVVDARSERSYNDSDRILPDAVRLNPDRAAAQAAEKALPPDAWLTALCA